MKATQRVNDKLKRITKIHGEELTCENCGFEQITTVTIHELSGVAAFSCSNCGKTQEA